MNFLCTGCGTPCCLEAVLKAPGNTVVTVVEGRPFHPRAHTKERCEEVRFESRRPNLRDSAERAAAALFVNGMGAHADRLVLELAGGEDGGGWIESSVADQIERVLVETLSVPPRPGGTPIADAIAKGEVALSWDPREPHSIGVVPSPSGAPVRLTRDGKRFAIADVMEEHAAPESGELFITLRGLRLDPDAPQFHLSFLAPFTVINPDATWIGVEALTYGGGLRWLKCKAQSRETFQRPIEIRSVTGQVIARAVRLEAIGTKPLVVDAFQARLDAPPPATLEILLDDVLFEVSMLGAQARVLWGSPIEVVNGNECWHACLVTHFTPLWRAGLGDRVWCEGIRCAAARMTRGTPVRELGLADMRDVGTNRAPSGHPPEIWAGKVSSFRREYDQVPIPEGKSDLRCHSDRDGECAWSDCPQLRDGEPAKSDRHCPLDVKQRDDDGL